MITLAFTSKTKPTAAGRSAFKRSTAGRRAFTIIELVVAMGIATIMMFLINRIFFDTTNAVSRGIGLSHIIGESRAISSTLETDFIADKIVKPTGGGFMFIGFKKYIDIDFANPRRQSGTAIQQDVISDQLLLVLDISTATQPRTSLTPQNDDSFSPYPDASNAANGLLWYGHVARLNPSGADEGEINNPNRNRFGHQWVVGRQLMFLYPPVALAAPDPAEYVNGPYARSFISGTGYTAIPAGVTPQTRWMALSDIINMDLTAFTGTGTSLLDPATTLTGLEYLTEVSRMAYVTERLRVASTVEPSATIANSFESWNLAQTHSAFMSFCSDFEISFAGDFDGVASSGIDLEDDFVGSGTALNPDYRGGNIKWYGYPTNDPADAGGIPPAPSYDPTKPSIYNPILAGTPVINGANPGDPFVTDEATLLPEVNTAIGGGLAELQLDHGIVFRHNVSPANIPTQWPHLLRIRYRLHDERGEIESTNGNTRAQGIWFEQIVRIQ